jgi:hypothetical protein
MGRREKMRRITADENIAVLHAFRDEDMARRPGQK